MTINRYQPIVSFVSGELSPLLRGRVDMAQYRQGAQTLTNVQPLQFGGARRRHGTERFASAISDSTRSRLIPFVMSEGESYVLEFNGSTLKIHDANRFAATVTLSVPGVSSAWLTMDYAQDGPVMVFVSPTIDPHRLVFGGAGSWTWGAATFESLPTEPLVRAYTAASFTPASSSANAVVGFSGSPPTGALGQLVQQGASYGTVTSVSPFQVTTGAVGFNPASPLPFVFSGPLNWSVTPNVAGPVGATVTVTTNGDFTQTLPYVISMNGGRIRMTGVSSATSATGVIVQELSGTTGATGASWSPEMAVPLRGKAVTFHESRMLIAVGNTIHGSVVGSPFDFTRSDLESDSFSYTIRTDFGEDIEYLESDEELLALTEHRVYRLDPTDNRALSLNNPPRPRRQAYVGTARVKPIRVGSEIIFARRDGRRIYSLAFDGGRFAAEDISVLAEHLFTGVTWELSFAASPVPTIYATMNDGWVAACTYDRSQSVVGWWRMTTNGRWESIVSVPTETGDATFAQAARISNTRRFIELFRPDYNPRTDDTAFGIPDKNVGLQLDCATLVNTPLFLTFVAMPSTFSGVSMRAVADGYDAGTVTPQDNGGAVAGQITAELAHPSDRAAVGFAYTSTIEPMPPEAPTPQGTGQGRPVSPSQTVVKVHRSMGATINGDPVVVAPAFSASSRTTPMPYVTGEVDFNLKGWRRDEPAVSIVQSAPYPLHVLFVSHRLSNAP